MNFLDYKDKIVCASKYYDILQMRKIYALGIHNFGENYVQGLLSKKSELKDLDIKWHFIGHLQSNKTKLVINEIDFLHSLDSLSLAKEIQKHRIDKLNCFIQVNLSKEASKSGVFVENLDKFILEVRKYDKISLIGFMTMGIDNDLEKTDEIFSRLQELSKKYQLNELSMGMSQDYTIALKYNSNYLRIGSLFRKVI